MIIYKEDITALQILQRLNMRIRIVQPQALLLKSFQFFGLSSLK